MNVGELSVKIGLDQTDFNSGLADVETKAKGFGSSISDSLNVAGGFLLAQGVQAVGTAFVGAAATSLVAAGDFESAVNNLSAIAGTSLADAGFSFDDVSAKALELGQNTAFSASQSIAAMTELVKGGVPVVDVMGEATQATLDLASAGGLELATAAEIVSKQLGVWGATGLTATQAADLLAAAANASTVGVEELALGLAGVAGTAKTAGLDFSELTQTMALIAPGFASAADAGTSLKTFISRLQPTTDPATVAMRELGLVTFDAAGAMEFLADRNITPVSSSIDDVKDALLGYSDAQGNTQAGLEALYATFENKSVFYDAQGSFIGMEETARLLQEATGGLSEEQKVLALNTIFGSDALRAAAGIATAGADGFNAMGVSMAAAGTAAEVAAIQNQGFNFAMDSLMGSLETLQIIIGGALLPIITRLINEAIIPIIGHISTFAQSILKSQDPIATLVAALTTANPIVSALGLALGALVAGGLVLLAPVIAGAAVAFGGLLVAALPVIAILGVAMAVGAALAGAWQGNFGNIQGATVTAMTAVQSVVQTVLGFVTAFWQENGAQIVAFSQKAWGQIQEIIGGVIAIVLAIVTRVFSQIQKFMDDNSTEIQATVNFLWSTIQNVIQLALNIIQGIVTTVLGLITGDWEKAKEGVLRIVGALVTYVKDQFAALLKAIETTAPGFLASALGLGQAIVDGIVQAVTNGISFVVDATKELAQSAIDAAKDLLGISSPSRLFADEVGTPISQGVAEGILAAVSDATNAAESLGSDVLKELDNMADKARAILDGVLSGNIGYTRNTASVFDAIDDIQQSIEKKNNTANASGLRVMDAEAKAQKDRLAAAIKIGDLEAKRAELQATAKLGGKAGGEALKKLAAIDIQIADARAKAAADEVKSAQELAKLREENAKRNQEAIAASNAGSRALAALEEARVQSSELAKIDPSAAQDFLALRTKQIKEIQALEERRDATSAAGTRQLLDAQIDAIKKAQALEAAQFQEGQKRRAEELGSGYKETGNAIVDGIIAGLQERSKAMADTLTAILAQAFEAAKVAMGIRSPSTLFRDEVGGNIIQGLADGLSMTAPVTRAMNSLTSDIGGISVGGSMGAMGMNSGGSGIVINMDLRGSSLTRPEVENIVRSNFVALGKRLNTL